ncbi:MSHA biogenesis protein MshQ [gamma proteobacterium IMCC2047]|nr:MSHA biogenesis protein MshQ [gamma proteobacterium IMCC2047]
MLPIDADGVTIADINLNTDNTANNDHALIGVSNQRYGRLVIDNAFGPEALPLGVPVRTEYWNYSAFITNTDDSASAIICPGSQFSASQFKVMDGDTNDSLSPNNVNPLAFGPILSGESTLQLSAPNASGPLDIYLDLPASSTPFVVPDWLRFDFNGDGTDQSPSGRALFGQYRSNDRIIYWQEKFD